MREDYLEQLEKMFPRGFIVIYSDADNGEVENYRTCYSNKGKRKNLWILFNAIVWAIKQVQENLESIIEEAGLEDDPDTY